VEDGEDGRNFAAEEAALMQAFREAQELYAQAVQYRQDALTRADRRPELEEALAAERQALEEARTNLETVQATLSYLRTARERLSTGYLLGMRQRFLQYFREWTGQDVDDCDLDADLSVLLEGGGSRRESGSFSRGWQDMIALCLRFALIDALFPEEEPFLVLDDPFVNLDDRHLERALAMLRKQAERRQILYLVCHSSRCVES
jgi:uncharacterized protein YhaN